MVVLAVVTACGDDITMVNDNYIDLGDSSPSSDTLTAVSVRVSPESVTLKPGETFGISTSCFNATDSSVVCPDLGWSTGSPSVATVTSKGVVTALSAGSAMVCAQLSASAKSCTHVTVSLIVTPPPSFTISSVSTSPVSFTLWVGGSCGATGQQMTSVVTGTGEFSRAVTWTSSNASVATVDASGLVTGVGVGSAQITTTSVADTSKKSVATVTVSGCPVSTDTVTLRIDPPTVSGSAGGEGRVTCMVTGPTTFTDRRCFFYTENPSVVVVVQNDTTFLTDTTPWGVGWRPGGLMKFREVGTTKVCVRLPGSPRTPSVCSTITVTK